MKHLTIRNWAAVPDLIRDLYCHCHEVPGRARGGVAKESRS